MKIKTEKEIAKKEFYRILAHKANFTLQDTYIFWQAVEEIFAEAITNRVRLSLPGFGNLDYYRGKDRIMRSLQTGEIVPVKGSERVTFKLSVSLRDIIRPDKVKKPWLEKTEEIEIYSDKK